MSTTIAELESQALQLAPEDRALLAHKLLASLTLDRDAGIEESWAIEAERRLSELENDIVAAVPVEIAIARAREAIR